MRHAGAMLYGGVSAMVGVGLIAGTQLVRTVAAKRPIEEMVLGGLFGLGLGAGLLGSFTFGATAAASTFLSGLRHRLRGGARADALAKGATAAKD